MASSQADFPGTPASPSGAPAGYTQPSGQVSGGKEPPKTTGQILNYRSNFIEMGLRKVVEAVNGVFVHGIGDAFDQLKDWADGVGDGLQKLGTLVTGIDFNQTPGEVWGDIVDVFVKPLNAFADLVGGLINSIHIPILDPTKILNLPALFTNFDDTLKGIFNGWFGSGATGTVAEVTYTIEAIKDAVINGYTVTTFTSDSTGWTIPPHAEMTAVLIGGGQNGAFTGGLHGSFVAMPLDLTGFTALDIQIGTAGNRSCIREAAVTPHTGTLLSQSPVHGSDGGIAGTFGLTPTNSIPGSGGNGGAAGPSSATAGTPGQASGLALGGSGGGVGPAGGNGGAGGSVSAGSQVKCGGGGGGGGGGANVVLNGGGWGGAGGYPGGAGGGGGLGWGGGPNGANGPGAPGVIWLFYR